MDQREAPLLDAVRAVAGRSAMRLHTPAHQGSPDAAYAALMGPAIAADLTELDETDDLRDPQGVIARAQALAADLWRADRTWFLVGGASVGNVAALLACRGPGGRRPKIAIGRNAHVSAISGLVLADWEPVWVEAPWDARWAVARPPDAGAFARALADHPEAEAVFATTPGYFGDEVSVGELREVAGDRPLIVDEAHGAHRPRALGQGADLVVHSAHKGVLGPTQGGYLHHRGERVDPAEISGALRLLQTTSPSYWILAGLDAARRQAAIHAREPERDPASLLRRRTGLEIRRSPDPTRVLVGFADGPAAYDRLAARGLVCEAALASGVLLLIGEGSHEALERVAAGLLAVAAELPADRAVAPLPPPLPARRLAPRQAALSSRESIAAERAIGRICAEALCPYPPGIPVLVPGEEVDEATAGHLRAIGLERVEVVRA